MADPYDYTQMWSGVYTPTRVGDEGRGVYLLDDEPPGGAGCADSDGYRSRESFDGGGSPRALYARGSRRLGHPGEVTSRREGRRAVDGVAWDNHPPHFADDTPNKFAHLSVPTPRPPPTTVKNTVYPGFVQTDGFAPGPASGPGPAPGPDTAEVIKIVLLMLAVVLLAMWIMVSGAENRIALRMELALVRGRLGGAAPGGGG